MEEPKKIEKESYPHISSVGSTILCMNRVLLNKSGTMHTYCYKPEGHPGKCGDKE